MRLRDYAAAVNRPRAVVRGAALLLAATLAAGCQTTSPPPPPTPSASPTVARPRFELASYPYALQTKGRIRVAVRAGFPPLAGEVGGSAPGRMEGFEPDLAREIARGIFGTSDDPDGHIVWVPVDDATRVTALTSGQADIAVAALPIDDAATRTIDLSDAYLTVGRRLLVRTTNDQIREIGDVATGEQTVCARTGSQDESELRKITRDRAKILDLATLDFCLQALATGAADAIVGDEVALMGIVAKRPGELRLVGAAFATMRFGIGMKKSTAGDRQGLRDLVNTTLLAIVADRTWAKLYEKDVTPLSGDRKQLPSD